MLVFVGCLLLAMAALVVILARVLAARSQGQFKKRRFFLDQINLVDVGIATASLARVRLSQAGPDDSVVDIVALWSRVARENLADVKRLKMLAPFYPAGLSQNLEEIGEALKGVEEFEAITDPKLMITWLVERHQKLSGLRRRILASERQTIRWTYAKA